MSSHYKEGFVFFLYFSFHIVEVVSVYVYREQKTEVEGRVQYLVVWVCCQ